MPPTRSPTRHLHRPPPSPVPGRAALSNPPGRFESVATERLPAGDGDEPGPPRLDTVLGIDAARSIIARNRSPDVPFSQSINPYRGCEHGCIYCYARPSHGYLGLSAGLDFETRLFYKPDAARLLERELAAPGYRCLPVTLGANTDPYQPVERELGITRALIAVLAKARHPLSIITKSALVLRDTDLLAPLAALGLVRVFVSITTLDDALKRTLEPRAASPAARLRTVSALRAAGIPVGVLVAPVIPGLTDHELEAIVAAAAGAGADRVGYILLRLPYETKALFAEWLATHVPEKAARITALLRDLRGGAVSDARFGSRMTGEGPLARLIARRFELACRRAGIEGTRQRGDAPTHFFRRPEPEGAQLGLDLAGTQASGR